MKTSTHEQPSFFRREAALGPGAQGSALNLAAEGKELQQKKMETFNETSAPKNGCFNGMIPDHHMENGCFTKHPLKMGCLGYQVYISDWQ